MFSRWKLILVLVLLSTTAPALNGSMPSFAASSGRIAAPTAQGACPQSQDKLVLAFYYPWYFGDESFVRRKDELSDQPQSPYSSFDPMVIDRHVRQAKSACIDALIVAWTGLGSDTVLALALAAAKKQGLAITIYFETESLVQDDVPTMLKWVIDQYAGHPAFLKWQGKTVVFFWRPQAYGGPDKWASVRQQVDPGHAQYWSVDTLDMPYLSAFDNIHLFGAGNWAVDTDVAAVNAQFKNMVATYNVAAGTKGSFTPGVIPGWDESRVLPPRQGAKVFPRRDGALYVENWQAAISINPEWVTITSFNEWFEGTQIEPSVTYGDKYLTLTRAWVCRFKGGCGVAAPAPSGDCETMNERPVCGKFLAYWKEHGGLAQQGFPISGELDEVSATDGKTYRVQYFERAVFELHQENNPPNDVLLSLLGRFLYSQKYPNGAPGQQTSTDNPRLFPQTGKTIGGKFRAYWESHGGLAQQGFPISEEFDEVSALDGKTYRVQYFERAVFELHQENNPPFDVLLSQLGKFRYRDTHGQ